VNQADAQAIIEGGITYQELRELMQQELDGSPSKTIRDFTKRKAQFLLSGCIGNRSGRVNTKTHSAVVAELILREFG
jgi:outer membrane lipopolysaccharide assembly protein LptE/RlpB